MISAETDGVFKRLFSAFDNIKVSSDKPESDLHFPSSRSLKSAN